MSLYQDMTYISLLGSRENVVRMLNAVIRTILSRKVCLSAEAKKKKQQLVKKMNILLKEYNGDAFVPYRDEVGTAEKERVLVWKMEENPFRVRLVWKDVN